ncbi:type 2 lanthipeptide synthetase LanM family protein [Paenibacillus oceani]|uniref:Type 2 lantipeptide synthetase LanM n=1 Tax=Paenibacillus oceani TaxID=2772510 RepID=A0A927CCE6_9BACL|nr:type 2 lanthipeptide synthetase LanM family protein [Paenibacillus oceani]MBD2865065.1 type 2 lantipeptide synthetase LanM [Paenibacillus oceani]
MIDSMKLRKATYAHERKATVHTTDSSVPSSPVQQWRERTGLTSDAIFSTRLKEDGLSEAEFAAILEQGDQFEDEGAPEWQRTLSGILSQTSMNPAEIDSLSPGPFTPFISPFLYWLRRRLLVRFRGWECEYGYMPVDREPFLRDVVASLGRRLMRLADRVLIAELHVAKQAGALTGDTGEQRFRSFVAGRLTTMPDIAGMLHRYPVLARLMTEQTMNHEKNCEEMTERFLRDREELERVLGQDFSQLVGCSRSGDAHRGGRSVHVLRFASGERLMYKARSLAVDSAFQRLLEWANRYGAEPPLPVLKIVDRQSYGWTEYVRHEPCVSPEQINRFYRRHGQYLALLHIVHAVDFHYENVIAQGEYPYLVDLETIFHRYSMEAEEPNEHPTAARKASELLRQSVLRSGLLPSYRLRSGSLEGMEVSGIGAYAGQTYVRPLTKYKDIGTDEMRLVRETAQSFSPGGNRPYYGREEVGAEAYADDVAGGFNRMYRILLAQREPLAAEDGPIHGFAKCPVRVLVRNTDVYGQMLEASLNPACLGNGLARVQLFDFMWRIAEGAPALLRVIHSECADLLDHDIPYFSSFVSSTDVWDSRGKRIGGYFPQDSLSMSLGRIGRLSEDDRAMQESVIRASMLTLKRCWERPSFAAEAADSAAKETPHAPKAFEAAAVAIAERLASSAVRGDDERTVTWIGTAKDTGGLLSYAPMDAGLYNGTLGLALFFAYAAKETGVRQYQELASGAAETSRDFLRLPGAVQKGSVFYGLASYLYASSHLSRLLGDDSLLEDAIGALDRFDRIVAQDRKLDLMAGSAGISIGALRLYEATGERQALGLAVRCGEHLLSRKVVSPGGAGWPSELTEGRMLAGFSHGASGYAYAFSELFRVTGDERFLQTGREAIRYERSLFVPEEGNWLDLRSDAQTGRNPVYWCHGAPGIVLSRILTGRVCGDDRFEEEIGVGLRTTLARWRGSSSVLCHGDMGNLDVLLTAALERKDDGLRQAVYERASLALGDAEKNDWLCDVPPGAFSPGLMTGLAGIGNTLLRLSNPALPSLTALQPPPAVMAKQAAGIGSGAS